jgi:hypothetical protein
MGLLPPWSVKNKRPATPCIKAGGRRRTSVLRMEAFFIPVVYLFPTTGPAEINACGTEPIPRLQRTYKSVTVGFCVSGSQCSAQESYGESRGEGQHRACNNLVGARKTFLPARLQQTLCHCTKSTLIFDRCGWCDTRP